jgi:hypothetical protein
LRAQIKGAALALALGTVAASTPAATAIAKPAQVNPKQEANSTQGSEERDPRRRA